MTRLFSTVLACAISVVALPTGASAAPDEAAIEAAAKAYEAGVGHFKAGRFADAIREFNKAYRVDPNPILVFNMARAFEELKEYASAIEFYRKYLEMAPEAEDRAGVEQTVRTLELLAKRNASAAAAKKVELSVTSTPDDAQVLINGKTAGRTPLKVELEPGAHFVVLEKDGFSRDRVELELTDEPIAHDVTLVALTPEPAPMSVEPTSNTTAWVLLGVGGALLAGGAVTGALALQRDAEVDEIQSGERFASRRAYDDLRDEGFALAVATDGLLVGGAAGVIAGGVMLLFGDDDSSSTPAARRGTSGDRPRVWTESWNR